MSTPPSVLVVDDVEDMRFVLRKVIERAGMQPVEAEDGRSALNVIRRQHPDIVVLDIRMPDMDGYEVFRRAKELDNELPIIMITAFAGVDDAVRMVKAGAYDYLPKPFSNEALLLTIHRALDERRDRPKPKDGAARSNTDLPLEERMGHSRRIQTLASEVARVAPTNFSVLIIGETGVGKEVVAQAIHAQSNRSGRAFTAVDCGAIPETLMESEFFGYEKGAFTGADRTTPGKFEAASGGTLFLDEISNLPLPMQSKLLRVLQEKRFYRVGGRAAIKAEARIVAATNKDLSNASLGLFRRDLYHRLSEYVIHVPPLRERKEDIMFLARRFLERTNEELGKNVKGFSEQVLDLLLSYDWPGNVRELRNITRRGALLAEEVIRLEHLEPLKAAGGAAPAAPEGLPPNSSLKEISRCSAIASERAALSEVLEHTGGNKAQAARLLRIDYKTIHTKIKKYGITVKGNSNGQET